MKPRFPDCVRAEYELRRAKFSCLPHVVRQWAPGRKRASCASYHTARFSVFRGSSNQPGGQISASLESLQAASGLDEVSRVVTTPWRFINESENACLDAGQRGREQNRLEAARFRKQPRVPGIRERVESRGGEMDTQPPSKRCRIDHKQSPWETPHAGSNPAPAIQPFLRSLEVPATRFAHFTGRFRSWLQIPLIAVLPTGNRTEGRCPRGQREFHQSRMVFPASSPVFL